MDLRSLPLSETISGFSFVASHEEIAAMDMLVGPTRPMLPGKRGGRRIMGRDCVHPCRHHIQFLDVLASAVSPATRGSSMELVGSDGAVALYRFPLPVIDHLATLTPERGEFALEEISSIAKRVMADAKVPKHYQEGGVRAAVHMMRGDALKALPRGGGKEVYYWCYRSADAARLRTLEP